MKRTAESYLRSTDTQLAESFYDFADREKWPDDKLAKEIRLETAYQNSMHHSPERMAQLERKIGHLVFEVRYRLGEWGEKES